MVISPTQVGIRTILTVTTDSETLRRSVQSTGMSNPLIFGIFPKRSQLGPTFRFFNLDVYDTVTVHIMYVRTKVRAHYVFLNTIALQGQII